MTRIITSRTSHIALAGAGTLLALVCGCSGGTQPPVASSSAIAPQAKAGVHRHSWMSPDAKRKTLLYISDEQNNAVYAYSYPKGKLEGTLTGFTFPEGLCADKNGDIFVANNDSSNVIEYAHGGSQPIATLDDTGYYPTGCSVDPTTGNLAVTNTYNTSFTGGSVAVYAGAAGTPAQLTDTTLIYPRLSGYDPRGNLWVDGFNSSFSFTFSELPAGGSTFTTISLNQTFGFPGGVQWDGSHVAVDDADANTIYQFSISGSSGTETGSTVLGGARDVGQFWQHGKRVIGPDTLNADVGIWKYPAGGNAVKTITGLAQPFGATISTRKK
ncbi:MAG TPA: hypothetical protein VGI19_19860 [Candidatus Cybelea sp.]|jgi:DNA-binding beta-propeller fold protein YncE